MPAKIVEPMTAADAVEGTAASGARPGVVVGVGDADAAPGTGDTDADGVSVGEGEAERVVLGGKGGARESSVASGGVMPGMSEYGVHTLS